MAEQSERFEAVLMSMADAVVVVDEQLSISLINPAAQVQLGADQGRHAIALFAPFMKTNDASKLLRESFAEGKLFEFELQNDRAIYTCRAAPMYGESKSWVLVFRETTNYKSRDEMKSRMIHMMSHDLKNPLAAIVGQTQLMMRKLDEYSLRDRDSLKSIAANATRMEGLINGVLDLELAEAGIMSLQSIELHWLFNRLLFEYQPQAAAKGLALSMELPDTRLMLRADERQMYQAFSNLVGNAIKYTPNGGQIDIRLTCDDSRLLIEISDTGYGVPQDLKPRIFERFYRARSVKTVDIPGTGIGLSLVKAVIEAHKGKIWFESEEDQGTTFFIELGLAEETEH